MNKKLLATAVAAAMVAPTASHALDTKISGHVNRMIRFADNGDRSDVQFLDNAASQSRFRFDTSGNIGGGVTAGIIYEAALASNNSSSLDIKEGDGGDSAVFLRHSALYFSGDFGRVDLGHTTEAFDGIAYADLSGTGLADEVDAGYASRVKFVNGSTPTGLDVTAAVATTGGGRNDLIKYQTPNLGGFGVLRASISNESRWGVGAFLDGSAGGGEWQLNVGYGDGGGETDSDTTVYGGSAAFLFSQGTNVAVAASFSNDVDRSGPGVEATPIFPTSPFFPNVAATSADEDDFSSQDWYLKLGHKWGNNAVSASYGYSKTDSKSGPDVESDRFGLAYVHTLPTPGIELYAGYHLYMASIENASDPDDINVFHVGTRVKFN